MFSGCGGLDLGFSGGFSFYHHNFDRFDTQIVFANDFDVDAQTCYNANPLLVADGVPCLLQDIRTVNTKDIPDFDILLAGFPCQPFSNAGNRKGVNDDNGRGTLFEECERILRSKIDAGVPPIAFVFENVRGIMSSKMNSGVLVPDEIRNRMHAYCRCMWMNLRRMVIFQISTFQRSIFALFGPIREAFGSFMAISRKVFTCEADCYVSLRMTTLVRLDSKYAPF